MSKSITWILGLSWTKQYNIKYDYIRNVGMVNRRPLLLRQSRSLLFPVLLKNYIDLFVNPWGPKKKGCYWATILKKVAEAEGESEVHVGASEGRSKRAARAGGMWLYLFFILWSINKWSTKVKVNNNRQKIKKVSIIDAWTWNSCNKQH